jgi:phosphoglycerate dehydrogenase-like enzyme
VLLEALDSPGGLFAMALDVTDPEPLPPSHPLFSHPRVILTPHISGDMEGYVERSCELFIANVEGIRAGKAPINQVHLDRGY